MAQRRQSAKAALTVAVAPELPDEPLADGQVCRAADVGKDVSMSGAGVMTVVQKGTATPARRPSRDSNGTTHATTSRPAASRPAETLGGPWLGVHVEVPVDARIVSACSAVAPQIGGPRLAQLGVCSSVRGEGRTSIAAGMALAQGRDYGRATLLVDLDFDRPGVGSLFGVPNVPGIADVLEGRAPVASALHAVGNGVVVMPAGSVGGASSHLAAALRDSTLLGELQQSFELIVADLPALLDSSCSALLASLFDPLVLVIRANVTPTATVRQALASLDSSTAPVVLLNGARSSLPRWLRRIVAT
jgi:Mrp family chromosome partitioning ATPase